MSLRRCSSIFTSISLCFVLAAALSSMPLVAQSGAVTVRGTVTDASGGVLPAVRIEAVVAGETVATVATESDGRYAIALTPGLRHQLRARLDGFADGVVDVPPDAGNATRDFQLGIAAISDSVVVTASRTLESRSLAAESIAVFSAEDVAALGSNSLAEVVARVPGLAVEATGREGAQASLFSRGGESDYNLVLIDGVQVNLNGGQFDFSRVSASEIERVEVVRGAQSALYGSDAIGSVVQIFTRRSQPADRPQLFGSIEGGTFDAVRGNVGVLGGARRRVDYQASVSYRGTNGAFADTLPEKDRFDQLSFDGTVGTILGDSATMRTGLRYGDARGRSVGQIAYGPGDTGTSYETEDLSWYVDLGQRLSNRITHDVSVAYFRNDSLSADTVADAPYNVYTILTGTPGAIFPASPRLVEQVDEETFDALAAADLPLGPGEFLASTAFGVSDFPFTFESHFRRQTADYQIDVAWLDEQVLSAGYEYERESDPIAGFEVDTNAYFAQQQFSGQDRWTASVGVRVNDNSRYGTDVTPKVSAAGYLRPFTPGPVSSIKVFTNVGRGIKNPTFDELFGGDFADGNPDLHPERARTFDVGTEVTFGDQRWLGRVAFFDNRYRDQVAFVSSSFLGPDGVADFINVNGSKASGVELGLYLQRPLRGVTASATYALVETEVTENVSSSVQFQVGQPLLRRPKHSGAVQLAYSNGPFAINVDVRRVGERHDSAFLFLSTPDFVTTDITVNPAYTVIGLGGTLRVRDDLTLFLRLGNLTDAAYQGALGFPGLPRALVVGGRFRVGRRQN